MKEIEFENFKSFGRQLRLPLLHGYTAVTGPNGSGKSNMADAVLFVLGPKSSKVIRAGRLTDLIYNGGKDGQPARYCRVSLVFDNADRTIPLDEDEVRLTRYVGLSPNVQDGYNSYFYVNGRKASLQAFDDLLSHARISADGYNIVQQGDVAKVVDMSPVERRRVLEEIAGISKFDEDIRKAESKRRGVEENLDRLEIILNEIRRQLRQLEKDRESALRYKEFQDTLEQARAQQAHKEVDILVQQVTSNQKQVSKYEEEQQRLQGQKAKIRESLAAAEERLRALEAEVARSGGDDFKELKERLDSLRIERARSKDGIERAREEIKELRSEARVAKKELERTAKEVEALGEERRRAEEEATKAEAAVEVLSEEIAGLETRAAQSDDKIVDMQKALVALEQEIDGAEAEHKGLALEREKLGQRLHYLEERIAELREEVETQQFEVKDAQWQLGEGRAESKAVTKELSELRKRRDELETERQELTRQSSELESAVRSLSREYSHLRAEAEAAEKVQQGYNRAVSAVLEARDEGKLTGVHGTVAELAQVKREHEVALNVAAGARMQALVMEDDEAASKAIHYLKANNVGRAIFLPMNKMVPGRPRGKALMAVKEAVGFAIDLVSFDEKYRNAFWYVFGDTVVVEDLAKARRLMGGVRLVTLDGQLVEAGGAMIGGQTAQVTLKFGQAAKGRLTEVGEELRRATEQLEQTGEKLVEVNSELESLDGRLRELQGAEVEKLSHSEALDRRLEEARKKLVAAAKVLEERESEHREANQALSSLEERLSGAEGRLNSLRSEKEAKKQEIARITPERIAKRLRELQTERLSSLETVNDLRSRARTLRSQVSLHEDRRDEIESRLSAIEHDISKDNTTVQSLREKLTGIEQEILGLQKMEERILAEMKGVRDGRDSAFREKTELEGKLAKLESKLEATEDFLISLKDQSATLQDRLREEEAKVREVGPLEGDVPSMEEIRSTISRCEKALNSIGAVNLRALEDYDAQQSRHDELKEEVSRMKQERKNLVRLVEELEGRKVEGLMVIFQSIRDNFVEIFEQLSEGGEAEMLLENEESPFEGGLIIKARPSKKRFLRLEALSGGEKSLVSMAFIFAIQEFEPSPFYLLDEVDQNLDAINAERIALMIRANSTRAQFIQISLRKVSLKEADHIIGVTMGDRAISKVVMRVDLDEIVEEVPEAEVAA